MACGCSAFRELPPLEYAARPERENVRVETRTGTSYQFDRIAVSTDSLQGYRRLDTEGPFEEFEQVPLAFDEVRRMSVRRVDWYRTGLLLGVGAAAALAAVLTQRGGADGESGSGSCGPRPCP